MANVQVITACPFEPVSVDDMMLHSRIDSDTEYTYVSGLISAARRHIEQVTWRQLMPATLEMVMDDWPGGRELKVLRPPLISVSSLKYTSAAGAETTFSASDYVVDTSSEPARLVLKANVSWPGTELAAAAGIRLRYLAGYGTAALTTSSSQADITAARLAVPETLRHAIKMLAAHWYENREQVVAQPGVSVAITMPFAVDALLQNERVWEW